MLKYLDELMRRLSERYGRARVNIAIGLALFAVIAFTATTTATSLIIQPLISDFGRGEAVSAADLASAVHRSNSLLVVLLCAAGFAAIWLGIVRPLETSRRRMRDQLSESATDQLARIDLQRRLETKTTQLRAALEDNAEMRGRLKRDSAALVGRTALVDALVATSTDAMLVVASDGRIADLTPFACELLGWPRESAVGRPFEQIVRLYDEHKEHPREYPLDGLIGQALETLSTLPRVQTALLIDRADREQKVVATLVTIIDAEGHCAGATVRLARSGGAGSAADAGGIALFAAGETPGQSTRLLFERRFDELVRLARSRSVTHSLLMFRLDQLPTISDRHGYAAAEELMRRAAQTVRDQLAGDGECFQLSVDRLAVLLGFRDAAAGLACAERLREAIASREIAWKGKRLAVTASAAVVAIEPAGESRNQLLDRAEALLASVALAGGNAARSHEADQNLTDRRRLDGEWLEWIRPRLADGRAHFISQAGMPLTDASVAPILECYLRVEDDDGAWLTPGAFLPALERMGQTSLADLWMLRAVLDEIDRRNDEMDQHGRVFLNFSVESLLEPDFCDRVFQVLATSTVAGSRICFEFDERSLALHPAAFIRFGEAIRPTGAGLALDRCRWTINPDLVREAKVAFVKFHESVIKRSVSDTFDRAQLDWLIRASHLLDMRVVACGVEDQATLDQLKGMGVDYAQGLVVNKMGPLMC